MIKKEYILIAIFAIAFIALAFAAFDFRLKLVHYNITTNKIAKPVRIALLTDLHAQDFGENQAKLFALLEPEKPDVVLLAGDIFDDRISYDKTILTLELLAARYPCYYVSGNHDNWTNQIDELKQIVRDNQITVLEGDTAQFKINDEIIEISGIDDPEVDKYSTGKRSFAEQLAGVSNYKTDNYHILLTHRPELIDQYLKGHFDLMVAGHAHGGQWRIPYLLNGLLAPNQGLFPKYAGGRFDFGEKVLIVSRGLTHTSTRIPRIFNRPELVIIDLK